MMNMMKAGAKGEKNKILISCQTEAKEAAERSLAVMTLYQALMRVWSIYA